MVVPWKPFSKKVVVAAARTRPRVSACCCSRVRRIVDVTQITA
jgi:hypothetical protein